MLNAVKIVFAKEIRCFLRDRNILIYSLVFPIFLYPLTFWIMNEVSLLQRGSKEQILSRVAVVDNGMASDVVSFLEARDHYDIQLLKTAGDFKEFDAVIEVRELLHSGPGLCYDLLLHYNAADERSITTYERLLEELKDFETGELLATVRMRGLPDHVALGLDFKPMNVAGSKKMGSFIIGQVLPMMIVIMAAMGTLYPAIDVIVGERERRTMETTLLAPIPRLAVVLGKFFAVLLAGFVAVFLNIGALALTAGHTLFLLSHSASEMSFSIPFKAFPLLIVTAILVSAGFGIATVLIASYARTFREAQSYVTPFFVIGIQPAVISALPGITLTPLLALAPITNVALMFRDAINGTYHWLTIMMVLTSTLVYILILAVVAARRINNETVMWADKIEKEPRLGGRSFWSKWRIK